MYIEVRISSKSDIEEAADIITAILTDFPFHTFSEDEGVVLAYGEEADFTDELKDLMILD